MDVPELVADRLGDDRVTDSVDLGSGDALYATPSRTIIYRDDGLLRDESVEVIPHDVDRIDVSTGRKKTTITLEDREGTYEVTVPSHTGAESVAAVLRGVLRASGAIDDETVLGAFRFSELTVVVTDAHLLTHVGSAAWAEDYESYSFEEVTGLAFEEGSHAVVLVLEVDGRPTRLKLPPEDAHEVRETVESALFEWYDVESLEALNDHLRADDDDDFGPFAFGSDDDDDTTEDPATDDDDDDTAEPWAGAADPPLSTTEDVAARLADLEETLEHQTELLERQGDLIDQLVEELRRGR